MLLRRAAMQSEIKNFSPWNSPILLIVKYNWVHQLRTQVFFILTSGEPSVNKIDLQASNLSGTYCHKTGTRPPICTKPWEPTIFVFTFYYMKNCKIALKNSAKFFLSAKKFFLSTKMFFLSAKKWWIKCWYNMSSVVVWDIKCCNKWARLNSSNYNLSGHR